NIQSADDVVAVWDDLKATEKPHRSSVLDGIPQGMPALALADKLVGRAEKVGVVIPDSAFVAKAAAPATEAELGAELLALVATARGRGLDPERALRGTLRNLQGDIRATESSTSN
ncbi:MAG: nucleoside triphosphate pyrophosphohydrolase, partial [Terrimesophilobacter sp.]